MFFLKFCIFEFPKKQPIAKLIFENQSGNTRELLPINIFDKIHNNQPVKTETTSNKYTFIWRDSVEKYQEKLKTKINRILEDIEQTLEVEAVFGQLKSNNKFNRFTFNGL